MGPVIFLGLSILSNNKRVCSVSKLVKNAATGRYECMSTLFVRDGRCDYKTEQHIDMRLVLVLLLLQLTGYAQWLNYPTAGVPHLPNGQPNLTAPPPRTPEGKPDFTGLWEPDTSGGTQLSTFRTDVVFPPEGCVSGAAPLLRCSPQETSGDQKPVQHGGVPDQGEGAVPATLVLVRREGYLRGKGARVIGHARNLNDLNGEPGGLEPATLCLKGICARAK
jgi:hypothetical protein